MLSVCLEMARDLPEYRVEITKKSGPEPAAWTAVMFVKWLLLAGSSLASMKSFGGHWAAPTCWLSASPVEKSLCSWYSNERFCKRDQGLMSEGWPLQMSPLRKGWRLVAGWVATASMGGISESVLMLFLMENRSFIAGFILSRRSYCTEL